MDENLSKTVTETFVQLYQRGLIYRGKRLVNWDPVLMSAVSDLEVESEEEDGWLWHICYPFADGAQLINGEMALGLVVATTRPETMLGDVAVMVHPHDERYAHLIGQRVNLPLCDRTIPVIADEYVDRSFGTGVVKVTPAHDQNDYAVGQRRQASHDWRVLTLDAKVDAEAPASYQGLDRFAARKQIVKDLDRLGPADRDQERDSWCRAAPAPDGLSSPCLPTVVCSMTRPSPDGVSIAQGAIDAVTEAGRSIHPKLGSTPTTSGWTAPSWCISRQLWSGRQIAGLV